MDRSRATPPPRRSVATCSTPLETPSGSAFRRNVAEHIGIATSAVIKSGAVFLTDDQLAAVRAWIIGCEVAWLSCATGAEAVELENRLKAEFRPELTKR